MPGDVLWLLAVRHIYGVWFGHMKHRCNKNVVSDVTINVQCGLMLGDVCECHYMAYYFDGLQTM